MNDQDSGSIIRSTSNRFSHLSAVLENIDATSHLVGSAQSVGKSAAFQMVAQTSGLMVENAGAFVQNVMQINLAAIAVATKKFAESDGTEVMQLIVIAEALLTIELSVEVAKKISEAAGDIIKNFPVD